MNRELPKNIEAEKSLLGSMFWTKDALQKGCEEVSKDIFYLDSHAKIFEAIKNLYLNNTPLDIKTLTTYLISTDKLKEVGGVEYLNEIVDSAITGANIAHMSDTLPRSTVVMAAQSIPAATPPHLLDGMVVKSPSI